MKSQCPCAALMIVYCITRTRCFTFIHILQAAIDDGSQLGYDLPPGWCGKTHTYAFSVESE